MTNAERVQAALVGGPLAALTDDEVDQAVSALVAEGHDLAARFETLKREQDYRQLGRRLKERLQAWEQRQPDPYEVQTNAGKIGTLARLKPWLAEDSAGLTLGTQTFPVVTAKKADPLIILPQTYGGSK